MIVLINALTNEYQDGLEAKFLPLEFQTRAKYLILTLRECRNQAQSYISYYKCLN
jgi:hypothetical protein